MESTDRGGAPGSRQAGRLAVDASKVRFRAVGGWAYILGVS
jgi:hypothetical protein